MAQIAFENVHKVYPGGITAVSDFQLEIADGQLVVILGPSGCGKSTTLRMVAGLEEVTSGSISIGEKAVDGVPSKDRNVVMVFQDHALYPHMTARENMAFALKLRKLPKSQIRTRIQEAAHILGLENLLDRRPKALSGGQRQRVAVGRAIVRKPAVFLFDEPLSNLDAGLRARMRMEIKRLHVRLGATMLYVTHDQVEAMTLGQQIVVMRHGVIQQVADPVALYDSPANKFVAGFVGSPPMNFFEGHVRWQDGQLVFAADGGFVLPVPKAALAGLSDYVDHPVTLGIRPEHVGSAAAERVAGATRITASVEVVEPAGCESRVYLRTGDDCFVIRVDSHETFPVGEQVSPALLIEKMHFFDPATETSLNKP